MQQEELVSIIEEQTDSSISGLNKVKIYIEDGIVISAIKKGQEINLSDAKEIVEYRKKLQNSMNMPMLVNQEDNASVTLDARRYFAGYYCLKNISACAIVTRSLFVFAISNTFVKLVNGTTPIQIFRDKDNAIKWLKELM